MSDLTALIKANPLLPAEDYEALRKQGFHAVERLGSNNWTEYNNSDPGITILEAVCYAITDLAYRTGFEIKDLLAPEQLTEDTWKNIFYTARHILHNNSLTINDYRKLIIDVKGVRNAWIEPSKDYEVPVWIDYNYYERKEDADCDCEGKESKDCYGKLGLQAMDSTAVEKRNDERKAEIDKLITDKYEVAKKRYEDEIEKVEDKLRQINRERDPFGYETLLNELKKWKNKVKKAEAVIAGLKKEKEILTDQVFTESKIVELEGLYNVLVEYEEDIIDDKQRDDVRQRIVSRLYRHRNLCEDFLGVNQVDIEDFGISASVALEEYADPDEVLARMFFAIYKYFTPSVQFYTIPQMMDKGYSVDEIFEGPALRHGFIDTNELEKTDLFRDIRLSDIVNEFVPQKGIDEKAGDKAPGIKGIKAITFLNLPFKDAGNGIAAKYYFDQWVHELVMDRKIARIQPGMSSVIFCKEHETITYNTGAKTDRRPDRMLRMFNDLKKQERKYKLQGQEIDFKVPAGEHMQLQDYYPVTYSLPMCYGVSERAGLPLDATDKRRIQALQLKGYMLFFEQLLSDYLVQLDHLRDLFSFDDAQKKTYFTKALDKEIEGLQSLVIDHANRGEDHFDQILNDFTHVLHNMVESPAVFYKRRNRFLDHLLARFSENMEDYERISRWLTPQGVEKRMIKDKTAILKDGGYYQISTNRAKAYNYSVLPSWDTDNVSGAELRISRLLGFANAERRSLAPDFILVSAVMVTDEKTGITSPKKNGKHQPLDTIKLVDPDNRQRVILTSVEVPHGCCTESLINDILWHADERKYFRFRDELKQKSRKTAGTVGSFWFELWDDVECDSAALLARSEKFENHTDRDEAFNLLQKVMSRINNEEGLHLVEHLLLRPRFDIIHNENGDPYEVAFPDICLDKCDIGRGTEDEVEPPRYRKKITRIPPEKCYDNMPWVLEYLGPDEDSGKFDRSILFKQAFPDRRSPVMLTFRRYETLTQRVKDIHEYGSELINYRIVDNSKVILNRDDIRYGFRIVDNKENILAQSLYNYSQRTPRQKERNEKPADDDIDVAIQNLMSYFEFELDLYCDPDPCDNNEDPFSFTCTIVLPCWPKRLRNDTFRNLVEKTIQSEMPAHIYTHVKWVGIIEMREFEKVYSAWLKEMAQTEMPGYEIVNPLVEKLNSLVQCGCCHDDCHANGSEATNSSIK